MVDISPIAPNPRKSGRTFDMLEQVIARLREGAASVVIVVHTSAMVDHCRYLLEQIAATPAEMKRITFEIAGPGAERHLAGRRCPVFVDHAAWPNVSFDLAREIERVQR